MITRQNLKHTTASHLGPSFHPRGGIASDKTNSLPSRLIVKTGFNNTELATFGSSYFTATDKVKAVLEVLDPRFEFYPLEVVDLVKRSTRQIWLMHSPHRVQVINLEATGDALVVEQTPPETINGKLVVYQKFYRVRNDNDLVLDKAAIDGLHLWSGIPTSLSGSWFCSEEFKRASDSFARSFDFEFTREE
jgi:hypothetical protein